MSSKKSKAKGRKTQDGEKSDLSKENSGDRDGLEPDCVSVTEFVEKGTSSLFTIG